VLVQQPCGEFGHGDGRLGFDGLDQESLISHQLATSRRAALTGWREGAGVPLALQQLDGAAVTDAKWRPAARQEWPALTKAATRTRRSKEKLWVMIHLLFSEGNHTSAETETS
jgi:hypothetical protein